MTPRDYLLDRFRADADTLRQRAAALRRGPAQPGPDANTSLQMASACEDVFAMIEALPAGATVNEMLDALSALVPLLEQRAAAANVPPVRAVYVGAATRIREVASVERQHAVLQIAEDGALHDDLADDEHNVDDDDVGDEDVDDDDVDDDDLDVATDDDAPSGGRVA